ncbi:uncharacterized protein FOMMEDRAFT_169941 [Fomitiporia mediterranea MF3/22]|uniref:uncharacterized protein n=1 Tax=Fomitiporia mediterranea (strain MF3/22) TaxID=694068 RepID=UPI0004407622|nr:uncharacterized protein FOMMEDRAFT_169941 [Fomitiporia mediterranea MF3/22]EJD00523.1 hypothetical protein FOMMEDRAFT_169941 [Fomitiporia mediterranea MF3/22]
MPSSFPVYDFIPPPGDTDQGEDILYDGEESIYELCSQQSSSNDNASNLPGHGRTLGLLYSRWGRALEAAIGQVAHRSGHGPKAVASRIKRVELQEVRVSGDSEPDTESAGLGPRTIRWTVKGGSEAKLRSDCRKLARYAT